MDVMKSLALGGKYVGVANHFLHTLLSEGKDSLDEEIAKWKSDLTMLLLFMVKRFNRLRCHITLI